jgi:SpoVK/Ycf46/Vps4 family AAA+-type ATPase
LTTLESSSSFELTNNPKYDDIGHEDLSDAYSQEDVDREQIDHDSHGFVGADLASLCTEA